MVGFALLWMTHATMTALAEPLSPQPQQSTGSQTSPDSDAGAAAATDRGAVLFGKYCALCHGENGDGAGKFAYLMNPRPRNFRQGDFKLVTTVNQVPSDDDLLRTISRGMPGSAMPPWGHLPEADLRALVQYVRQFHVAEANRRLQEQVEENILPAADVAETLAQQTQPGNSLVVPTEPEFDDVRWFRGRRVYLEACASCHGVDGHPVPEAIKYDSEGYPVPPRSFVNGIFKGGSEGPQLYARVVKGMKGTPMPAFEGTYGDDAIWDLIHYVQSLARAGAQQRAQLQQGVFTASRISGSMPTDPLDAAWEQARPLYVGLTPLWWTEERIEGLVVCALHNGEELVIRLSWIDPTVNNRAVRQDEFRDAVALQFSLSSDPPFYMGDSGEHGGVNIWMWKADRQHDLADGYHDVDDAFPARAVDRYPERLGSDPSTESPAWAGSKITEHDPQFITAWGAGNLVAQPDLRTSAECLVARGPGTLSGKPANVQLVTGQAVNERGVWHVQLQRSMSLPHEHGEADERAFKSGDYLPVSFAVWNGSAGDRDGKKNISIWQKLVIE